MDRVEFDRAPALPTQKSPRPLRISSAEGACIKLRQPFQLAADSGRSAIVLNRCHGSCTPRQFKKMAYNVVDPPMKRRFFAGPPKVTLETWCGTNIRPSNSPRELMQWTRRPHCSRCCHTRQRAYPKLTMVDRNHFLPVARSRQSGPQCSSAQLWSSHATPRTRSGCPAGHPFQSMSLN